MDVNQFYDKWVYHFRIENPVNRDAKVLVVTRDRCVDGTWEQEYLATDGWRAYAEYEVWDFDSMPTMTGMQLAREGTSMRRLVDQVTAALRADADGGEVIHVR